MSGRVLFALVWVIIAAGVALPLYPRDIPGSIVAAAADPVQLVAGTDAFGCEDCVVPDTGHARCKSDCTCGDAVPAIFVPLEHQARLSLAVTVPPGPSRLLAPPKLLSPKLPAI
jgi:hypothetical protein